MTEDIRPPRIDGPDDDKRARVERIRQRVRAVFKGGGDPLAVQAATLAVWREAMSDLAWLILELDRSWALLEQKRVAAVTPRALEPSGVTEPVDPAMVDAFTLEPDPIRAPLIAEPPHPRGASGPLAVPAGLARPPRAPPPLPTPPGKERIVTAEELTRTAEAARKAYAEAQQRIRELAEISGLFSIDIEEER